MSKLASTFKVRVKNEFTKYTEKLISDEIFKKFISIAISHGSQPLPILNNVDDKDALRLLNYTFNA